MSNIGYIYKIVCNIIPNEIYIGSTKTKKLSQRLSGHVGSFKAYLKGNGSMCSSYQIIARGDYGIHLLETVEYNTVYELRMRERYHYELCDCVNKNRPMLFDGEVGEYKQVYRKENRDKIKEYNQEYCEKNCDKLKEYRKENCDKIKKVKQEYYEKNRDKLKEYNQEYRKENCDKLKEYRKENRDKINKVSQEYYEKNRDKIKERKKEYYEKNREEILKKMKEINNNKNIIKI